MADYLKYTFLYEFSLGSNVWRFTSNAEDVIDVDGDVWEAAAISDSGVTQSGEAVTDGLTIESSIDLPPARLWMYSTPDAVVDVRILKADFEDKVPTVGFSGVDDAPSVRVIPVTNKRVRYVGEVVQCGFTTAGKAVFTVETISATMQRSGLRMKWQRQCEYMVYDPLTCKANKAANANACTIVSVAGRSAVVSIGMTPGFFSAGLLEYVHPIKGPCTLTIESNTNNTLVIFGSARDLWAGMPVTIYRGCDGTPTNCQSHGNYVNYGGAPNLPGKSPFDGIDNPMF